MSANKFDKAILVFNSDMRHGDRRVDVANLHEVRLQVGRGSKCLDAYDGLPFKHLEDHVFGTPEAYAAASDEQIDQVYIDQLRADYGNSVRAIVLDKSYTVVFRRRSDELRRRLRAAFPNLQGIWGVSESLGKQKLVSL